MGGRRRLLAGLVPHPQTRSMPRTEDGRAFTGQYRIDATARPEGMSLRLSLDADLLLRLVTDTGGPSLELAGIAPRRAPTLSWRRNRLGIVTTLLGLGFALGSLLWLSSPPSEPASDMTLPSALPELPPAPPALVLPAPLQGLPPPAPAVIRLDPSPEPASPAPAAAPVAAAPLAAPVAARAPVPAQPPAAPRAAAAAPAAKAPLERPATPPADVLDLFDDTK